MKALGRLNIAYFLVGFLGFLTTWILDMIYMFLHKEGVLRPNQIIKGVFSTFGPHYLLSRCLYDISQTYKEESGLPNTSPFTYAVSGRVFILLCLQAAGDCLLLTVLEFTSAEAACVAAGCDILAADTALTDMQRQHLLFVDMQQQHMLLLFMIYTSFVMQTVLFKAGCAHLLHGRSFSQCYQDRYRLLRVSSLMCRLRNTNQVADPLHGSCWLLS